MTAVPFLLLQSYELLVYNNLTQT